MKKIIIKTSGERDFSAQETMHHLLSIKLDSSSFNVVPISLEGSRRIRQNVTDEKATDDSLLDIYADREQFCRNLETINFVQFITKFKVANGKLKKQADNFVPSIFRTYSPNPDGPNFGKYCKYQLLTYKPWKMNQNDAWNNQQPDDHVYIRTWKEFLETPYAQVNVLN